MAHIASLRSQSAIKLGWRGKSQHSHFHQTIKSSSLHPSDKKVDKQRPNAVLRADIGSANRVAIPNGGQLVPIWF